MTSPLVELRNLSFRYPYSRRTLLSGVNLAIYPGDRLLVAGPSGAGKSTILSILAGFVPEWVPGRIAGEVERSTEEIASVFQNPEAQMVAPTVEEEIAFGLENRSTPRGEMRRRIDDALRHFSLLPLAHRNPSELSGGERQKVALAAAFALEPRLLLLDEPTSYLDPNATAEFFSLLEELPEETAVVIVEHKIDRVELFARRLVVLDEAGNLTESSLAGGIDRDSLLPWSLKRLATPEAGSSTVLPPDPPASASPTPSVEARRLTHSYGARSEALRRLDLAVANGETVAVMGPNGAGKTTLLERLAGTLAAQGGEVYLSGLRADRMKPRIRFRTTLYLPQNPEHFFLRELVGEELALSAASAMPAPSVAAAGRQGSGHEERSKAADRIEEAMGRFRLEGLQERNPYSLSEGEKRRLNLACALLDDRPLVLLDEPTFGLDYSAFEELVHSLRALKEAGCALLLVTHSPELAFLVADRIVYMERGSIVFEGAADEATSETFPPAYLPVWAKRRSLQS